MSIHSTYSAYHTCITVVWECCKDDRQGMAIFEPQPTPNP